MVLSAVYAYFFMNNLNVSQAGLSQGAGTRGGVQAHLDHELPLHRTFDPFIGFSASLPVLSNNQFLEYSAIWPIAFGFAGAIGPYGGFLIPQAVGR